MCNIVACMRLSCVGLAVHGRTAIHKHGVKVLVMLVRCSTLAPSKHSSQAMACSLPFFPPCKLVHFIASKRASRAGGFIWLAAAGMHGFQASLLLWLPDLITLDAPWCMCR